MKLEYKGPGGTYCITETKGYGLKSYMVWRGQGINKQFDKMFFEFKKACDYAKTRSLVCDIALGL